MDDQEYYFSDDAFHKAEAEYRAEGSNAFQQHKSMMDDSATDNFEFFDHDERTDRASGDDDDEEEDDDIYEDIDEVEMFGMDVTWLVQLRYTVQEKLEDAAEEAYELTLDAIHAVKTLYSYYWSVRSTFADDVDVERVGFRGGDTGKKRRTLWEICKQQIVRRPARWRRKKGKGHFFEYKWRF